MVRTNSYIENEKEKLNEIIFDNMSKGRNIISEDVLQQSRFIDEMVLDVFKNEYNFESIKLFEKYLSIIYDELYMYIFKIAEKKESVDDILQNTMLKAFKGFKDTEGFEEFKQWIFKIAKSEVLKEIIANKRDSSIYLNEKQLYELKTECSLDEVIVTKEFKKALVLAINNLKPKFRSVIIYKYYSNLTLEEIAKVMDVSISSVKVWHMKAKKEIEENIRELII